MFNILIIDLHSLFFYFHCAVCVYSGTSLFLYIGRYRKHLGQLDLEKQREKNKDEEKVSEIRGRER